MQVAFKLLINVGDDGLKTKTQTSIVIPDTKTGSPQAWENNLSCPFSPNTYTQNGGFWKVCQVYLSLSAGSQQYEWNRLWNVKKTRGTGDYWSVAGLRDMQKRTNSTAQGTVKKERRLRYMGKAKAAPSFLCLVLLNRSFMLMGSEWGTEVGHLMWHRK